MARSPAVEAFRKLDLTNMNFTVAAIRQRLNQLDTLVDEAKAAATSVKGARDITTLTANVTNLTATVSALKKQIDAMQASMGASSTIFNFMAFDASEPEDAFFGT